MKMKLTLPSLPSIPIPWLWAALCTGVGVWFFLNVVSLTHVHDHSMTPTLPDNSYALLVRSDTPNRGDIFVTRLPEGLYQLYPKLRTKKLGTLTLIKRVVAIPGDQVNYQHKPYILGSDEFWLVGDHASDSVDSRTFGPVQRQELLARAYPLPTLTFN